VLSVKEVRGLYPCLSEGQARHMAVMGEIYPWWVIRPIPGWGYEAEYLLSETPIVILRAKALARLGGEIDASLDFAAVMGWMTAVRMWSE